LAGGLGPVTAKQLAADLKDRELEPEAPSGPVLREAKCLSNDASPNEDFALFLEKSFRSSISKI
jgi:hypothetical protein